MSGTLYRDISSCTWTPTGGAALAINQVSSIQVNRGGTRIASSADDLKRQSLVDSTDHATTVVVNLKNFPKAVGNIGAGAKAPVRGAAGVLQFTVESADGGSAITFSLGDGANTFARFMGGSATPKHADVESGASMTFRGYCPDGDVCPLSTS
jgi:hypothetical protein